MNVTSPFRRNTIIVNSLIYTFGNALNALLPLLLIPYLTNIHTPEQYAKIAFFQMLVFILTPILGIESISYISRTYFDKKKNINEYISTSLFILILSSFIVTFIIFIFDFISLINNEIAFAFYLAIIYCIFIYPYNIFIAILINREEPLRYTAFSLSLFFLSLICILGLYKFAESDPYLRVMGQIVSAFLIGTTALTMLAKSGYVALRATSNCAKDIVSFSAPLVVHTLSGAMLGMGPQLVLAYFGSEAAMAEYSIALQVGSAIGLISVGVNKAITPWLIRNYESDPKTLNYYRVFARNCSVFLLLSFLIYILFEEYLINFLILFIDNSHVGFKYHLKWIVFGFLINGVYLLYLNILICKKETSILAFITAASSIIGLLSSYIIIVNFDSNFVAFAMTLAFAFLAFSVAWRAQIQ
ncbi:oligosaccharide flippase family protein [Sphingorhabdus buctiana]